MKRPLRIAVNKIIAGIVPALALVLMAASLSAASAGPPQVRRYLLSAGANNGGRERVLLRYAVTDARSFASVLVEMGGVERENALILTNPGSRELLGGIANLNNLIAGAKAIDSGVRSEVFVYYSGHADASGLKLGGETLSWADFRNAVNGISADVRVAVIDACGSGAITRAKGGVARPAFMHDASSDMKGYAYLTSSNENEVSQESDHIRGSYFTHALLSGMRGAADMTGDGRVTINEAYQYAFNETLQSTQNTTAGTQHPSRDMNLAGTGDIVITELRETNAVLSLAPDIEGRLFIRDEKGNLFAELRKAGGRQIELGVPPGRYSVHMEALSGRWTANNIAAAEGRRAALAMSGMRPMERGRRTVARGDAGAAGDALYAVNISVPGLSVATGAGNGVRYGAAARGTGRAQGGIINIAGELDAFQSGLINIADDVVRFQAGLINAANDAGRLQAGAVNIAMETGRQIGLVNFSRHSDKTPVGIISIVGNGVYDATAYADASGEVSTSVRTGTAAFYNLIEYSSVAHNYRMREARSIGWGFGTRFGMNGPFAVNLDLVWQSVGNKRERADTSVVSEPGSPPPPNDSYPNGPALTPPAVDISVNYNVRFQDYLKLRLGASYNPRPYIALTGGISLNAILDSYADAIKHNPAGNLYADREFRDFRMRFWPGIYTGVTVGKVMGN